MAGLESIVTSVVIHSNGTKLHCMTAGTGRLAILLHGFPDFWYTWRAQVPRWSQSFKVVAVDLRGYNLSGQPEGIESYGTDNLLDDVEQVIRHFGQQSAIIIGHDWGAYIGWCLAGSRPELVERLVVLNLTHPQCLEQELASNPAQASASAYVNDLLPLNAVRTPEELANWVADDEDRAVYVEAFRRSSIPGMLNYYRANFPKSPYRNSVVCPPTRTNVLVLYGARDKYVLCDGLSKIWHWAQGELTICVHPDAGHWLHRDQPDWVETRVLQWLTST